MKLVKLLFLSTLLLVLTLGSLGVQAQAGGNILSSKDLSTLKVDALSDNQITAIQQKLKQSGMTIDQVECQAIAKGMPPSEFAKLKDRVIGISAIGGIVMAKSVKKGNNNTTSNSLNCLHAKSIIFLVPLLSINFF